MVSGGFTFLKYQLGISLLAICTLAAALASAEEQYGLNWQLGSQWQYEDNLFLQSNTLKQDDTVLGTFAQARYSKRYSLQKFVLKGKITDYRYATADYLNYLGKDLDATWFWAFTPDLTGTLSGSRKQALNSFLDYNASERNLRRERRDAFDVRWHLTGGWNLTGGGAQTAVTNTRSGERFVEGDYTANSLETGVMYSFPSQSQITLVQMMQTGEYRGRTISAANQTDSGFDQTSQEARLDWVLTAKSRLKIKLGYVDRQHDHYTSRDYQGAYGTADYLWSNGGKFNLKLSAQQDLNSFQSSPSSDLYYASIGAYYYNSSYYRRQLVSITPTWQLADKISLSGSLQQEERTYLGGLVPQTELTQRKDSLHQGNIALTWVPRDLVAFSISGTMQDRRSSIPVAEFDANSAAISATLSF